LIRFLLLTPALLLALAQASASAEPNVNCGYPLNNSERTYCAEQALLQAETEMNAAYKEALTKMEDLDAPLPAHLKGSTKALEEAQQAWTTYRDKDCLAYSYPFRAGTRGTISLLTCKIFLTRQRAEDLSGMIEDFDQ